MKKKKKKNTRNRKAKYLFILIALVSVFYFVREAQPTVTSEDIPTWITQDLIFEENVKEKNLDKVKDIVIHYTGNPGTTAKQNRDYFAKADTLVNSHFIVGIDGEIIQAVPLFMKSKASNNRNSDTISIEVCHTDSDGEFSLKAYNSTVKLAAWLCDTFEISRTRVIRHGDITGKLCPLYFMEHEDEWEEFKNYIENYQL